MTAFTVCSKILQMIYIKNIFRYVYIFNIALRSQIWKLKTLQSWKLTRDAKYFDLLKHSSGKPRIFGSADQFFAIVILAEDQGQLAHRWITPLRGRHVRIAHYMFAEPPNDSSRWRTTPRLAFGSDRTTCEDLFLAQNDLHDCRFN